MDLDLTALFGKKKVIVYHYHGHPGYGYHLYGHKTGLLGSLLKLGLLAIIAVGLLVLLLIALGLYLLLRLLRGRRERPPAT
ncbi:hypothetical protein [Methanopyrus kandleri]|uniref:hypothetical protein n=1 Tax=Methanopyrus kandleri TaxID=2320 RepID=UPI0011E545E5|nr:hypothetical protein [Methanopyrus kandleri]